MHITLSATLIPRNIALSPANQACFHISIDRSQPSYLQQVALLQLVLLQEASHFFIWVFFFLIFAECKARRSLEFGK